MDHSEIEHFMVRMAEMQPRVPEWCKAEHMEISVPQKELWCSKNNRYDRMIKRFFKRIIGTQTRREANP